MLLGIICINVPMQSYAQLLISNNGTVHISDDESWHNYYYFDIKDRVRLSWLSDNGTRFVVKMPQSVSDTVSVSVPNLLFKNYNTNAANILQTSGVYTLASSSNASASKGFSANKINGLNKILGLETYIPSKNEYEIPSISQSSMQKSIPEILTEDTQGDKYYNSSSLICLLIDAYNSLSDQSAQMQEQLTRMKEGLANAPRENVTNINEVEALSNSVSVSPNPFSANLTVHVILQDNVEKASLQITSANGVVMKNISISERGKLAMSIESENWAKGIYFCSLITDGTLTGTIKVIKK